MIQKGEFGANSVVYLAFFAGAKEYFVGEKLQNNR